MGRRGQGYLKTKTAKRLPAHPSPRDPAFSTPGPVGLTIATFINAIFCLPIGALVDRVGPRAIGLIGVPLTCGAFALLGTASRATTSWYALWAVLAFATLPVQATIWTSAVASRFEVSRGLALAITLCGASIGATVFPLLATWLISSYGWRGAFLIEGAMWVAITFPTLLLFFRRPGKLRSPTDAEARRWQAGPAFVRAIRGPAFVRAIRRQDDSAADYGWPALCCSAPGSARVSGRRDSYATNLAETSRTHRWAAKVAGTGASRL